MHTTDKWLARRTMKAVSRSAFFRSACVGLALALGGAEGCAQSMTENFSYPNGSLIGQNGGTGWSSAWFQTFSSGATNANISSGRLFLDSSSTEQPQRNTSTVLWGTDGSSAYVGFMMRLENPVASGASASFTVITRGTSGWGIGVLNNALRIQGGGTAVNSFFTPGTDYQFVLRLTRSDAGSDAAALWVNPTSEADTPLRTTTNNYLPAGTLGESPISVSISPQEGTFSYDNIRLGTSFGQVAVPEPGTGVMLCIAGGIFASGVRRRRERLEKAQVA